MSASITFGTITIVNSTGTCDIFLVKYDPSGNVLWAKSFGGTGTDEGSGVAIDNSGNAFLSAWFTSPSITFGTSTFLNMGYMDMCLVKLDQNGNVLWARQAGGSDYDESTGVCVDAAGNAIVTGWFMSPSLVLGTTTLTSAGNQDMLIVKFDPSGNVVWARSAGGPNNDGGIDVGSDQSGNVYLAGYITGVSVNVGSFTVPNAGNRDVLIAKYDMNGNVVWAYNEGGALDESPNSVLVDASGSFELCGSFKTGSITIGPSTLVNTDQSGMSGDIFFGKFTAAGTAQWAKSAGGMGDDFGKISARDGSGNLYMAGTFFSPVLTIGTFSLSNADATGNSDDVLLAKLDASGNLVWAKNYGGIDFDEAYGVSAGSNGDIYAAGLFMSPVITFGNLTLNNAAYQDVFLVKMNGTTGVNEEQDQLRFDVLPNPTTGVISIDIPFRVSSMELTDVAGKVIWQASENTSHLDISGEAPGIYFLTIFCDEGRGVEKIMKH